MHLWQSHVPYNLHAANDKNCDQAPNLHLLKFVIHDIRPRLFTLISKFVVNLSIYHFFCNILKGLFINILAPELFC